MFYTSCIQLFCIESNEKATDCDYLTCSGQKHSMDEIKEIAEKPSQSVVEEDDGYITAQCQQNQNLTLLEGIIHSYKF